MENPANPQILPQTPVVQAPPPANPMVPQQPVNPQTPPPAPHKRSLIPWVILVVVLLTLLIGSRLFTAPKEEVQVKASPTPTPTTAALTSSTGRTLSPIASHSAFIEFEASLEELSRGIQNTQVQNQQLLPPRLDLPLGF